MISPPPSPIFTYSLFPGKPRTRDENFQKNFCDEDQISQLDLKRCHVHPDSQPSRRDPLSPTDLVNTRSRVSHSADSSASPYYHSLVTSSSVSDLRVLLPEQPVSSGHCGMRPSGTFSAPVCSWPPPVPVVGSGIPSHRYQTSPGVAPPTTDSERKSSRATFLDSTSTWNAPDFFQTKPTTSMTKPMRTSSWKSENLLQPIRSRTNCMPSMRRPPGELWRSDPAPTKAIHAPVDAADSSYSTPPGLPPRQPDLRRSSSGSDLHTPASLSLSLALGSQPLKASEHTKTVPPIGAERSRAVSTTSHRNSSATQPTNRPQSPWCSSLLSPRLQAKWKNDVYLLDTTSLEKAQAVAGDSSTSKEDLERLLRHAARNKYAPKIISPLSPLRTAIPAFDLSTDPEYQLRMPSLSNNPSSRHSKCRPRRARTACDSHQTLDWDTTCMHCEECKRDTIGKRLLAFRHRQHQAHQAQRTRLHAFSSRGASASVGVDDDRIALASRIREVFSYVMDEEEKSLWEEIAAVTGAGPLPLTRVGARCATATYRRVVDSGVDEGHDDYMEIPDDGLRATESATLFRDVTVY